MSWSFSAHGFLGDVTAAEKLLDELRALLSKPETGTMGTSFTGPGVTATDFHLTPAGDVAPSPAVDPGSFSLEPGPVPAAADQRVSTVPPVSDSSTENGPLQSPTG